MNSLYKFNEKVIFKKLSKEEFKYTRYVSTYHDYCLHYERIFNKIGTIKSLYRELIYVDFGNNGIWAYSCELKKINTLSRKIRYLKELLKC
jgi:hypothetical protein